MTVREWGRLTLAFDAAWLGCAAISVWSLQAALGTGAVRSTVPVSLRVLAITQAAPWVLTALMTPIVVWLLGRTEGRLAAVSWQGISLVGAGFIVGHSVTLPVLAVLLDRGEWTWPRWDGPLARAWIASVSVALQYGVMAATVLVRRSAARTRQLERDVSEAHWRALRTTLQPHFLFNALHSVSALLERSPQDARAALSEIGYLLRWSLDHDHRRAVTVGEELDVVERYLSIERLRMGERLRVRYDVDESVLDAGIMPFLLQPIVENAVRHGVAPNDAGGDILIIIRTEGAELIVAVRNSVGAGDRRPGVGVGQPQVRDRLRSLYGERGRCSLVEADGWYDVTVRWPIERVGVRRV